jgi:hypothetical protein
LTEAKRCWIAPTTGRKDRRWRLAIRAPVLSAAKAGKNAPRLSWVKRYRWISRRCRPMSVVAPRATIVDSLYVLESSMRHFFIRAEMGKNAGRKQAEVDEDYKQAAALAALVAPYRHARLAAVKLAGEPNNPLRIRDDATADELRAEVMRHIARLTDAGIIDLEALPAPKRPVSN